MKCASYTVIIQPSIRRGDVPFCALEKGHKGKHHGYKQAPMHPRGEPISERHMRMFWEWDDEGNVSVGLEGNEAA